MNHIDLMGRLTRDPELRHTQSGTPVASFTLAVDRRYAPKDGGERPVDFIDCVAWRQTGEFISKYFSKGQMLAVSGSLQIREWTDREGNKRRSAEVVCDNAYFTESRKSREASGFGAGEPSRTDYNNSGFSASVQPSEFEALDEDDGDLPF
ncbi:MAG: single-stranded DNA-binding protein [Oscillospiraceae bacterium]|nr:single-stranded DNA-binding protein [Oscillospiraceae bacterium]